jgi:hypothetical protein
MDLPYSEGGHTVYLPPPALEKTPFKAIKDAYPPGVGLKIARNPGDADSSEYLHGREHGTFERSLTHGHPHLTLVANLLHVKGLGPRLYDLLELRCGDQVWTAYVIEHVNGREPTLSECEAGIKGIRDLENQGLIKLLNPGGYDHQDLQPPLCGGNAWMDERGNFRYVDFQAFLLSDYGSYLERIAIDASKETHFGDVSLLRGGRHLYQSIPAIDLPYRRNIDARFAVIDRLMERAGVSVRDRLVLDIGCNIGMMMGQYLKAGAKWCHGWDLPRVTEHCERLLFALGCTRFSTTGCEITRSRPLLEDLPDFLRPSLESCAISYLAIRGHVGWLDALAAIPWSLLIYEGHENEGEEDFQGHLDQLRTLANVRLKGTDTYVDGDSDPRRVAVLLRNNG